MPLLALNSGTPAAVVTCAANGGPKLARALRIVEASPEPNLLVDLLDLAETLRAPWTLVGGQMVLLHALEHGQVPPQISQGGGDRRGRG